MEGKVVLITGATSGIGRAAAELFAQKGLKIALCGRRREKGEELAHQLIKEGTEAVFIQADVSKADDVESMIQKAQSKFGSLNFAFNNAGIEGSAKKLADFDEEEWKEIMDINLKGTWLSMKYEIPALLKSGRGAIVNVSSEIATRILPGLGIYSASKAGVELLTKAAAVEYGPSNIRVNAVAPGAVDTPMLRRIISEEARREIKESIPLKKIGLPQEVAQVAYALCSESFSHVNGATLFVDGGSCLV